MIKKINIRLELPIEFSFELDADRQDQKRSGINNQCSKAELIIRYAQLGRKHLKKNEA